MWGGGIPLRTEGSLLQASLMLRGVTRQAVSGLSLLSLSCDILPVPASPDPSSL